GTWVREDLYPELTGSLYVAAVDSDESNDVWITRNDFHVPATLCLAHLDGIREGDGAGEIETIKTTPERFDANGVEVTQHFV
ncbi:S9 family peptidase, partial [Streptococcus pseudopneumoniae]|uniref:hypothetical protein n=1 Tax=Streptococcus pseudopneumoniae TaxID=257758 RepID=UPI0019D5D93F